MKFNILIKTIRESFRIWCILLLSLTLAPALASAKTFTLEPYLGYGFLGDFAMHYPPSNMKDEGALTGIGVGTRAVFHLGDFFTGLDFGYFPSFDFAAHSGRDFTDADSGSTNYKLGLVLGVEFRFLPINLWIGLGGDRMTDRTDAAIDVAYNGYSYKAGLGYRVFRRFHVNLEYIHTTYLHAIHTYGGGSFSSGPGVTWTHDLLFLSGSIPLF